eukprot:gene5612-5577_t
MMDFRRSQPGPVGQLILLTPQERTAQCAPAAPLQLRPTATLTVSAEHANADMAKPFRLTHTPAHSTLTFTINLLVICSSPTVAALHLNVP